jgi:hypothetical protein
LLPWWCSSCILTFWPICTLIIVFYILLLLPISSFSLALKRSILFPIQFTWTNSYPFSTFLLWSWRYYVHLKHITQQENSEEKT